MALHEGCISQLSCKSVLWEWISLSLLNVRFPHDILWAITIFSLGSGHPRKSHPLLWFLLHLYSISAPSIAELFPKLQMHLQIHLFINISIWMSLSPSSSKCLNLSLSLHLHLSLPNLCLCQCSLSLSRCPRFTFSQLLPTTNQSITYPSPTPLASLYFRPPSFSNWPFLHISLFLPAGGFVQFPCPYFSFIAFILVCNHILVRLCDVNLLMWAPWEQEPVPFLCTCLIT